MKWYKIDRRRIMRESEEGGAAEVNADLKKQAEDFVGQQLKDFTTQYKKQDFQNQQKWICDTDGRAAELA